MNGRSRLSRYSRAYSFGAASSAVSSIRPTGLVSPIQAFCCGRIDGSLKRGLALFQTSMSSDRSSTGGPLPLVLRARLGVQRVLPPLAGSVAVLGGASHASGDDANIHRVVHNLWVLNSWMRRRRLVWGALRASSEWTRCGNLTAPRRRPQ